MINRTSSLDTSVVVRLLVGDPVPLFERAALFLQKQRVAGAAVHVSDLVLAEAYFALQSFYRIPKAEALEMLGKFAKSSGVTLSPEARAVLALPHLATAKPGFVDRLIHAASRTGGHTLITFEKAAKKLPSTLMI